MRRDYKAAIKAAVSGLYSGGAAEMGEALREILEALDPDLAALMDEDEDAAMTKANGHSYDEDSI